MRRPHHLVPALLALSLGVVGLAGCGDDDGDVVGSTPPSEAPSSVTADSSTNDKVATLRDHAAAPAGSDRVAKALKPLLSDADQVPTKPFVKALEAPSEGTLVTLGCYTSDTNTPDDATSVDCSQPHATEVYAALDMDDSWPDDWAQYDADTDTHDRWRAWAIAGCNKMAEQAAGGDGIAAALGLPDNGAAVPMGQFSGMFILPSRAEWENNQHITMCALRSANGAQVAGSWPSKLLSADRPTEVSGCLAGEDSQVVTCDQQHWLEDVFWFNASDALDQAFVDGLDVTAVTDEQWATLDEACGRAEAAVIGQERDDLRMYSNVNPDSWNAIPGLHPVMCSVTPADKALDMIGSAIGLGDGEAQLVPTAVPAG